MTTIRKIVTSKIDGSSANNTSIDEIRPFGEAAFYVDSNGDTNKLVLSIHDGVRTHLKSKVLAQGILYGSNADSSDGNNYDTIKLIPDAELFDYGSNQYIIVDPTAPNHIHIRAGGTIDNSNAALFLGGENSNVEIQAGENPPVYVRANNNIWMFDTDGSLTFPGSSNARIGESEPGLVVFSDNGFAVVTKANSINTYEVEFIGYVSNGFGDDSGATLTVTEIIAGTITDGMTVYGNGLPPEGLTVTFGGGVMEPQGSGGTGNYLLDGANILTSSQSFNNGVSAEGSYAWIFSDDGSTRLPNNSFSDISYLSSPLNNTEIKLSLGGGNGVQIVADEFSGSTKIWEFDTDGSITFPDNTVQTTASVQGEQIFTIDTGAIDYAPTAVDFNLLLVTPAVGYSSADPTSVTLPNGVPGQRLVIINGSSLATLTVNPGFLGRDISSGVAAEFIYTSMDGWIPLYGTNSPT
jgi:hypothetical protein